MSKYTAIGIFHHPDGVLLPGETTELDDDVAARGIEAGTLGLAQEPDVPPAPEVVEIPTETQE